MHGGSRQSSYSKRLYPSEGMSLYKYFDAFPRMLVRSIRDRFVSGA